METLPTAKKYVEDEKRYVKENMSTWYATLIDSFYCYLCTCFYSIDGKAFCHLET